MSIKAGKSSIAIKSTTGKIASNSVTALWTPNEQNNLYRFVKSFVQAAEAESVVAPTKSVVEHLLSYGGLGIGFLFGTAIDASSGGITAGSGAMAVAKAAQFSITAWQDKHKKKIHKDIKIKIKQVVTRGTQNEQKLAEIFRIFYTNVATDIFLRFSDIINKWCSFNDPDFALIEECGNYAGKRFYTKLKKAENKSDVLKEFFKAANSTKEFRDRLLSFGGLKNNTIRDLFLNPVAAVYTDSGLMVKTTVWKKLASTSSAMCLLDQLLRPPFEFEQIKLLNLSKTPGSLTIVNLEKSNTVDAKKFTWEDSSTIALQLYGKIEIDEDINANNALCDKMTKLFQSEKEDIVELLRNILLEVQELREVTKTIGETPLNPPSYTKIVPFSPTGPTYSSPVSLNKDIFDYVKNSGGLDSVVTTFHQIYLPTPNFCGRQELIEQIHQQIQNCSRKNLFADRTVVLHGLGGIGKSELARMYAHVYFQEEIIQNVAWIDAEDLSSIQSSFNALAKSLNLITTNQEIEQTVYDVYKHFSDYVHSGLFIFDNVHHKNKKCLDIFKFLPTQYLKRRPLILITTRDKDWEIPHENIIAVHELNLIESVELFSKKFQLTESQQNNPDYQVAITELARAFHGYPLGIALATSNIENAEWLDLRKEINDYLERMNTPQGGWINDEQGSSATTEYALIMQNVWDVTLNKIKALKEKGHTALQLLNLMAYLPTDRITVELLKDIFKLESNEGSGVQTGLHVLEKLSMIFVQRVHAMIPGAAKLQNRVQIHGLVQHCTRERLSQENNHSYLLTICNYLTRVDKFDISADFQIDNAAIFSAHSYLKRINWPLDSIKFSIIFCSLLITASNNFLTKLDRTSVVWQIAEDVHKFLNVEKTTQITKTKSEFKTLFSLCIFGLSFDSKYHVWKMSRDPKFSQQRLEKVFKATAKPCIKNALFHNSNLPQAQAHSYHLCFTILKQFRKLAISKNLQKQISRDIVSTVNSIHGGSIDNVLHLYRLVFHCFWYAEAIDHVQYTKTVFRTHFQVYDLDHVKYSKEQLNRYWEDGGPLPLYFLGWLFLQSDDDQTSIAVTDTIACSGGVKIFTDYLRFVCQTESVKPHVALFGVINELAFYRNWAKEFIQSQDFIQAFLIFTRTLIQNQHKSYSVVSQCLRSWFGLFAKERTRSGGCISLKRRQSFSIYSVGTELHAMMDHIERIHQTSQLRWQTKTNILKSFLENHKDDPNHLVVITAERFLAYCTRKP